MTLSPQDESQRLGGGAPYALVVEDDAVIQMHACHILIDAGFRTLDADDASEALTALETFGGSVTLLFTEVEMPRGIDGFELARQVATRWPHIEIVVTSGKVRPADGEMPKGAIFIPKPFSEQIVLDHLQSFLPDGEKPETLRRAI